MSRIGKKPIPIPKEVSVSLKGDRVGVKGPKGSLDMAVPGGITLSVEGGAVSVARRSSSPQQRALHGLVRSLVSNMVMGVSVGYEKRLDVVGVGYSARIEDDKVILNVGYCLPQELQIPKGIEVEIPRRTNTLILRGVDKQQIGQFAADIRKIRPPEPYKGKGIRYIDEFVRRKAGKSVVGGAK
ncbi:MAG: 50S ribosomal protein L6 [Planctomycetota bacterium]|jgi:large subunit ribosomal protein L6